MTNPGRPVASHRPPAAEAHRMTRLAGGAARLLHVLRVLRFARDDGTISAEQYEAAVDAIELDPDRPREP